MMKNRCGRIDLLTQEQIVWCGKYCDFLWFVKDDGKVYSKNGRICFKNKDSIDLFIVKFGDCDFFSCYDCKLLESLKGAPENVSRDFSCSLCNSLKLLEGAPKDINRNFYCSYCHSLKSLKGAPDKVGEKFVCAYCDSLETLKGASENVGGYFNCSCCNSLQSLEGASEKVGGDFSCEYCDSLEFIDGLKNTKIGKKIICDECPKLKKYDPILSDMNVFRKWQKSEYTADEFLKEYSGFIEAKKYGI